jgi:hypothetical protein
VIVSGWAEALYWRIKAASSGIIKAASSGIIASQHEQVAELQLVFRWL